MNWQHPFVDVFKQFGVFEIAHTQSKGQVSVVQDNSIGRKIIRLLGAISANNMVQIPDPCQGIKQLGLTGRYIYIEFIPIKGRYFTIHFDLQIKDRDPLIKLTVSNMYDVHKVQQSQLLIPYPKNAPNKWTILILDVEYFLGNFGLLPSSLYKSFKGIHSLKSFQICSSMNIRGIYTSDNLYDWDTMPKQMLFKLAKGQKWTEEYQIAYWPALDVQPHVFKQPLVEVTTDILENLQKIQENKEKYKQETQKSFKQGQIQHNTQQIEELVKRRPGDQNVAQSKSVDAQDHPLQPYPIQQLEKIIGFTVNSCPDIKWGRQTDTQKQITYAAGQLLIQSNIQDGKQKFFMGHSKAISCLDVSKDGEWLVSGQSEKNAIIRIWKNNCDCLSAFATPYSQLNYLSFSQDRKMLVTVGQDEHNREIIIVWGLEKIETNRKPILFAKQTSSCNILAIKFSPVDNNKILSCGHENIRFWRIKEEHLPGASVVLNHHARNTTFTNFDFEFNYEDQNVSNIYFGSKNGYLFQVAYQSQKLMQVYKVHNDAVTAVCLSAGFCITGSLDQYLRVWPLDFNEFYIEAKHEGIITSLDISIDGLQVACGTSTGGLGILDISSHHYKTVIRSHTNVINQIQVHPYSKLLITLSEDCTIRLWDIEKSDQVYEFTFPQDDKCVCLSSSPIGMYFAAGFKSGIHRIFDIEQTSILVEGKYHDLEIKSIQYSPNGQQLVIADAKSIYKLYDVSRDYQPIKTIQHSIQSQNVCGQFSKDSAILSIIENSTNIELWDTLSLQQILKIQTRFNLKILKWAENNVELLCGTTDGRIIIYGIERVNDTITAYYLREQTFMHKQSLNDFVVSPNMKYLFSVGAEQYLKVWDYEFQIKGPGSCQVFIGHSSQINSIDCADNGSTIITAGGKEGIFVWKFLGYTGKNERLIRMEQEQLVQQCTKIDMQPDQFDQQEQQQEEQNEKLDDYYDLQENNENVQPNKDAHLHTFQQSQLVEMFSLVRQIPQKEEQEEEQGLANKNVNTPFKPDHFKPSRLQQEFKPITFEFERQILNKRRSRSQIKKQQNRQHQSTQLPFRQYILPQIKGQPQQPTLSCKYMVGYNTKTHDNIIWCQSYGWYAYTSQNYIIFEKLQQDREQQILSFNATVSVIYLDKTEKHLIVGLAQKVQDAAPIYVYEIQNNASQLGFKQIAQMNFHTQGVHQILLTEDEKYLISVGNGKECTVVIWDFSTKKLITSSYTLDRINDIKLSKYSFSKERIIEFATVGRDQIYLWAFTKDHKLEYFDVFIPKNVNTNELEEITTFDYIVYEGSRNKQTSQSLNLSERVSFDNSQQSQTVKTEEILLEEGSKNQMSFPQLQQEPTQESMKQQQQQQQQNKNQITQLLILGLKSGEIVIMKYGEFKSIYRKQITNAEITYLKVSQAAGKIILGSAEHSFFIMDIKSVQNLQSFLDSGFAFQRIQLPAMVSSYVLDPFYTQGIFGLANGNIYLISFTTKQYFLLNASNGDQSEIEIKLCKLVEDNILVTTFNQGIVKLWRMDTAELLVEYQWEKEIVEFFYDAQIKQIVFIQEFGQIKTIHVDRLDIYDQYYHIGKGGPDKIISCVFGIFDSIPGKFVLDESGQLFFLEHLYKNQEYIIRYIKALELPNVCQLVEQCEKRVIFAIEQDTGVVSTLQIDYNSTRQYPFAFTLFDQVNFLANPHGNLDTEQSQKDTQALYSSVDAQTQITPAQGFDNVYFAILNTLQYLYGRNYNKKQIILLVNLSDFPLYLSLDNNLKVYVVTQSGSIEVVLPNDASNQNQIQISQLNSQIDHIICQKRKSNFVITNKTIMNFYQYI
ncbi:unnamed protein product [Paramecium octaurelia]|uniref:CFA20 domain-containing protein n=1 Tax=Paramecium octaurelia TaxID=43137 RepID=A0A8S1UDN3_PAROT|nr:unnamed protein product [Paramecium octaurelia]